MNLNITDAGPGLINVTLSNAAGTKFNSDGSITGSTVFTGKMGISFTEGKISDTLPDNESWVSLTSSGGSYTVIGIGPLYEVAEIIDSNSESGTSWAKTSSGMTINLPVDRLRKFIGFRGSQWGINTTVAGHEYKLTAQDLDTYSGPNESIIASNNPAKNRVVADIKVWNYYYPIYLKLNTYAEDIYKDGWNDACKLIKFTSSGTTNGSITVPQSLTTVADDNSSSKITYALAAETVYPVDSSTHKSYVRAKAILADNTSDTIVASGYSSQYGINTPYNDGYLAGWNAAVAAITTQASGKNTLIIGPKRATNYSDTGSTETKYTYKPSAHSLVTGTMTIYSVSNIFRAGRYIWYNTTDNKDTASKWLLSGSSSPALYTVSNNGTATTISSHSYTESSLT